MRPLCVDLFCGLGGWAEGALAEGYDVVGFDIERHEYWVPDAIPEADGQKHTKPVEKRGWTQGCAITLGMEGATQKPRTRLMKYPGQLVLQDILTLHGRQLKDAACIVASPPCQKYSYMAMPWDRAKREIRWQQWMRTSRFSPGFTLNDLFDACFRIQREASEAAGHHIPMVVENVKGAQPWVGSARWHYGSFYLWGDVPALMPFASGQKHNPDGTQHPPGSWFAIADSKNRGARTATKNNGGSWFNQAHNTESGTGRNPVMALASGERDGVKQEGLSGPKWFDEGAAKHSSRSSARKAASAKIAKIPFPLAQYIAATFKPAKGRAA